MQPMPMGRNDDLYHRAAQYALACRGQVKPAHYIHDLTPLAAQSLATALVVFDKGAGPFVVTGISYDPVGGGLDSSALVTLEGSGREWTKGQVGLDHVAVSTGAARDNAWQAAPGVIDDGGQLIARIQYAAGASVQALESLTVYGFHTDDEAARRILGCWGMPYWLRQALTSSASVQRPAANKEVERAVTLHRVIVEGACDDLDLVAANHRIRRGDARTLADQGPSTIGALGENIWPLVVPRGEVIGAWKRDTTARTTTVTWHGLQAA